MEETELVKDGVFSVPWVLAWRRRRNLDLPGRDRASEGRSASVRYSGGGGGSRLV